MSDSAMADAYESWSGFADENDHFRGRSLLKRKQEQWAKERAFPESWFPFGRPGGGAPNEKRATIRSQASGSKTETRSSSQHSNGDSDRSSGSENNPRKEDSERIVGDTSGRCAFSVESTNTVYPAITVAQQSQVMVEGNQQCLPPVVARPASFVAPVATSTSAGAVPVQFVYACDPYRQIVPVPVKVLQHPTTVPAGIPCAYPVPVISPVTVNLPAMTSADGAHHELPTLASSYPEQWANHLLYCGGTVARKEENNTQVSQAIVDSATYVSLPPIGGLQPVSTPTSVAHPILTSSCSCEQQSLPTQRSAMDNVLPKSASGSLTSLNSPSRRNADEDTRTRVRQTEYGKIYEEQVEERRRMEAQRVEEEKREEMVKERERRRMEEEERAKENEDKKRKVRTEEERARIEATLLASLEKAKHDAEMLRKAKLYRHVLENHENRVELEHAILGDNDEENSRILRMASSRHDSFDDDRLIKNAMDTSYISRSFGTDLTSSFPRDRLGRQSMRMASTPKMQVPRRAESAERPRKVPDNLSAPQRRRRITTHCAIPVRPQRRIPPPAPRSRRTSTVESATPSGTAAVDVSYSTVEDGTTVMPSGESMRAKTSPSESESRSTKMPLSGAKSIAVERELQLPTVSSSHSDAVPSKSKQSSANSSDISSPPARERTQRRNSSDSPAPLAETPKFHEKIGSKWRSKGTNNYEQFPTENPLFQPVSTRCRRSRTTMGSTDITRESSSCSSGSPPPPSSENGSLSPPPQNTARDSSSSEKDLPKTAVLKSAARSSAIKIALTNSGSTDNVAKSPFKQTLAEWGNANRHREELLSPEIRRKSDFPNSTRLRNSMANLNAEESDDGRASPVSPLIQRFNSKTSQYRSFNLKKTSERNQKVLDQLAQLREKLKQKQQQMERSFAASNGSLIRRSRNNGTVNPVSDKSHETFAIV